jgi:hypothetical protein
MLRLFQLGISHWFELLFLELDEIFNKSIVFFWLLIVLEIILAHNVGQKLHLNNTWLMKTQAPLPSLW